MIFLLLYLSVLTVQLNLSNEETPVLTTYMKKPDLRENKENLIQWLLTGYSNPKKHKLPIKYRDPGSIEYPGYDGWYNNIGRPEVGAVDTQLLRRLPAAYKDGVYKPDLKSRPNPLDISRELLSGEIGSESDQKGSK